MFKVQLRNSPEIQVDADKTNLKEGYFFFLQQDYSGNDGTFINTNVAIINADEVIAIILEEDA